MRRAQSERGGECISSGAATARRGHNAGGLEVEVHLLGQIFSRHSSGGIICIVVVIIIISSETDLANRGAGQIEKRFHRDASAETRVASMECRQRLLQQRNPHDDFVIVIIIIIFTIIFFIAVCSFARRKEKLK